MQAEREHAADLSHRLRTPLTALRLDAERLHDEAEAARISAAVDDLEAVVTSVIAETRRERRQPEPRGVDLAEAVRERMAFWSVLARGQGRSVELRLHDGAAPRRCASPRRAGAARRPRRQRPAPHPSRSRRARDDHAATAGRWAPRRRGRGPGLRRDHARPRARNGPRPRHRPARRARPAARSRWAAATSAARGSTSISAPSATSPKWRGTPAGAQTLPDRSQRKVRCKPRANDPRAASLPRAGTRHCEGQLAHPGGPRAAQPNHDPSPRRIGRPGRRRRNRRRRRRLPHPRARLRRRPTPAPRRARSARLASVDTTAKKVAPIRVVKTRFVDEIVHHRRRGQPPGAAAPRPAHLRRRRRPTSGTSRPSPTPPAVDPPASPPTPPVTTPATTATPTDGARRPRRSERRRARRPPDQRTPATQAGQ